jgi:hypothetical protein
MAGFLGVMLVGLVAGSVLMAGRAVGGASAEEFALAGAMGLGPDGRIVLEDGVTAYDLVSVIDLAPFFGRKVSVHGTTEATTLYVRELALGVIDVEVQDGVAHVRATGTVGRTAQGFGLTVEGIVLSLVGSDALDQVVGKIVHAEGELIQTEVTLTALRTEDGQELQIDPGADEDSEGSESTTMIEVPYGDEDDD